MSRPISIPNAPNIKVNILNKTRSISSVHQLTSRLLISAILILQLHSLQFHSPLSQCFKTIFHIHSSSRLHIIKPKVTKQEQVFKRRK